MKKRINIMQSLPAFLAVLLLMFANSSHIHLRYCLDGAESSLSIHFENKEIHSSDLTTIDALDGEDLADIETELSIDSLLAKFSKSPIDSLAIATFSFPSLTEITKSSFQLVERQILPDKPDALSPPTRAPPAIA